MEQLPNLDKKLDQIPHPEDTQEVFDHLLEGKEYKILRELEDRDGVYLKEVEFRNDEGGLTQYEFVRKGTFNECSSDESVFGVVYFDSEDNIINAENRIAEFVDGEWWIY